MTTTETNADAPVAEDKTSKAAKDDFTKYQDKEPTNLHVHYWNWLKDKTGVTLDVSDETAVKVVQMAVSAYQKYQASPENKQRRVDEAAERETKAAEAKAAREAAKAQKAKEAEAAAEAKKAEADAAGESPDAAPRQAPPKKGRASAAKGGPAAGEAPF